MMSASDHCPLPPSMPCSINSMTFLFAAEIAILADYISGL